MLGLAGRPGRRRAGKALRLLVAVGWGALLSSPASSCRIDSSDPSRPQTAAGWLASIDAKTAKRLERKGLAFPEKGGIPDCPGMTVALAMFSAPRDEVFALLIQTSRHLEYLDNLSSLEPVSRAPQAHVDRHEISILFSSITYHMRFDWEPGSSRIWWELSSEHPNDVERIRGFWELYSLEGGRTLGVYGTLVDVGPAIPQAMQDRLTRSNLRKSIRGTRAWVEREGGSR